MRYIYGFTNVAYYCGPSSDGDTSWYPTRKERDAALAALREEAVGRGLSESAARNGIRPTIRRVDSRVGAAYLLSVADGSCGPFITWHGPDVHQEILTKW